MSQSHHSRGSLRRALSAASAGALLAALMPATVAGAQTADEPRDIDFVCQEPYGAEFDDLAEANAHFEAIVCAADYEIALGHADDTYRPSNSVRRDQMASFIVRLIETAGDEELDEGDEGFDDVHEDSEHAENINKLANIDVVEGFEDDTYRPRQSVTRDQMASFIRRAIAYLDNEDARDGSEPPAAGQDHFDDVGTTSPHHGAINALAEQSVVVGDGEGSYSPRNDVRRDQMGSFLMRGYDYAAEARLVESPGPDVFGAGTLFSDRIEVGFDDGVEVTEVEGFRVYTDEACATEFTHGVEHDGGGPIVDVELADELDAEDEYFFRLDARSVEGGEGFPNVPSECIELMGGPISGDDDDNGDEAEGPQVQGSSAFASDAIEVLFDTAVTVVDVEGFRVHTDDACSQEVAHGVEATGDGFFGLRVDLSDEMSGEDGHWLRVDAGTVEDGDGTANEESDCIEVQGS